MRPWIWNQGLRVFWCLVVEAWVQSGKVIFIFVFFFFSIMFPFSVLDRGCLIYFLLSAWLRSCRAANLWQIVFIQFTPTEQTPTLLSYHTASRRRPIKCQLYLRRTAYSLVIYFTSPTLVSCSSFCCHRLELEPYVHPWRKLLARCFLSTMDLKREFSSR